MDSANQIIIAADVIGSGSEQPMLLPMIEQASAYRTPDTLVTADAGYHSDANIAQLMKQGIPAMVADNQMRARDERLESQDKYKGKPDPLSEKKATGQEKEVKRFGPKDFMFKNNNMARWTPTFGLTMSYPSVRLRCLICVATIKHAY